MSEAFMSFHLLLLFITFNTQKDNTIKIRIENNLNSTTFNNTITNSSLNNTNITNNSNLNNNSTSLSEEILKNTILKIPELFPSFSTNAVMYFISLLSPITLFMTYYFNACIAQNLAITFVAYKNNYHKRIQYYKYFSMITCGILLILAVIFNENKNVSSVQFAVNYYNFFYIGMFYFFMLLILLYIIHKLIFIIQNRNQFSSTLVTNQEELNAINKFILQHTLFLIFFLICYVPNNIIQVIQIFTKEKIISIDWDSRNNFYVIFLYLLSASCLISFLIKLTDPYMVKYIGVALNLVTLQTNKKQIIEDINKSLDKKRDISKILFGEDNYEEENTIELDNMNPLVEDKENTKNGMINIEVNNKLRNSTNSNDSRDSVTKNMDLMANTFESLNRSLSISDHIIRLIAMGCQIDKENYANIFANLESPLPWNIEFKIKEKENKKLSTSKLNINNLKESLIEATNNLLNTNKNLSEEYTKKSEIERYDKTNFPSFLRIYENTEYYNSHFTIRSYSPVVFAHIRFIDNISNQDLKNSLDYVKNTLHLNKAFAKGGRSANPILYTHDQKYLIKTISKSEKNVLIKMLPDFHNRLSKPYSLLCRIYGLYRIKVLDKLDTHIIIMKNMNELPDSVSYLYCF